MAYVRREKCDYMGYCSRKDVKLDFCASKPSCCRGLFFCSEALGLVTSSAAAGGGRHPLPVPACAALRRARGSPTLNCGSEHSPPANHVRIDPCSNSWLAYGTLGRKTEKNGETPVSLLGLISDLD